MTQRILIISASIGGGHVAAARALETAFKGYVETHGADLDVQHVDLLDYTTAPFRRLYRQTYFDLVKRAPEFVDWLGKRLDRSPSEKRTRQERAVARLVRLISYHLPRLIERYQPDVIVHTHFLAPEVLSTRLAPDILRLRGSSQDIPQVVVITDFFAHSLWLQPKIAKYFVASEDVAVHVEASGVEAERVVISGIPVDPRFAKLESKQSARRSLGMSESRDLLIFMASGLDERTLQRSLESLDALRWPVSAVVICGRSPQLVKIAQEVASRAPTDDSRVDFKVLGFSDDIPRYMAAADLLVGKPGGLTTSEALAAGLPFGIIEPYPIQEEANTSFLLEYGAAMSIDPITLLSYKVKRFLENDAKRSRMHESALALAHPDAAQTIVEAVLGEFGAN